MARRPPYNTSTDEFCLRFHTGGFGPDVDSQSLYSTFTTFGDVLDVQVPPDPQKRAFYSFSSNTVQDFQNHSRCVFS